MHGYRAGVIVEASKKDNHSADNLATTAEAPKDSSQPLSKVVLLRNMVGKKLHAKCMCTCKNVCACT